MTSASEEGDGARARKPEPSNIEAEQALLGAILVNNQAHGIASAIVIGAHFHEPAHRMIFEVAGEMLASGKVVTPATIHSFLPAELIVGQMTMRQYLARLTAEATTILNAVDYARAIYDMAVRRRLIGIGFDLIADASAGAVDIAPVVTTASAGIFEISTELEERAVGSRPDVDYYDVVDAAKERLHHGTHAVAGVSTGLLDLDAKLPGLGPGDLVIIAGRPSMGKSLLGLNICCRAAERGEGVLFDSLELTKAQVSSRILADYMERQGVRVPYSKIDRGRIDAQHAGALERAADSVSGWPLVVMDRGNRLDEIPGKIKEARRRLARVGKELKLYCLDYLGLCKPTDRYRGDRVREVGEMSGTLKALAKAEGIPFLVLHQLNRSPDQRPDRRPTMADLRDAGNIEQDADVVLFVYREAYYHERPGYTNETEGERAAMLADIGNDLEAIIAKQRQGPVGTVLLHVDVALGAIRNRAFRGGF